MKYLTLILTIAITTFASVANVEAVEVTLKSTLNVDGDNITFGDVFDGSEHKSNYVIATAPAPGKKISFNATSLAFVANKHGLEWIQKNNVNLITVHRQGQRIPEQQIKQELRFAMETELNSSEFELILGGQSPSIMVAMSETPGVAVENISYSVNKENFTAIVVAPVGTETSRRYKISGKFYKQVLVPVAAKLISSGDEITEENIDYKLLRASKVSRNVAVHIEDILGRSPKRTVRTGGTIALGNLGDPVTVAKGKLVAVTLKNGGITLSITGRALESGSTGDIIRVENISSRKPVQAQIVSAQEVRIITAQQRLAAIQ